ncbi:MAG TPA: peptide-methionine (S)-S-oxide reductase MsrA [Anaerolineales bacterium]|nr:peptide-methionine (S)-S-oxide reductase MsrA [Anaerolineales bacterium]HNN12492.1 peptide-methionine (S)-S-oxide reductase MsrA [Anaerolineales bacterium]HNO31043.1 peptide-methionine (S)-S-oxide reductase MsrA [Anaerolineales bacterium]
MNTTYETITLAGGCFWCLEAVYDEVKGVLSVDSGYANGHVANPSYRAVCNGDTGHAEVVQIKFDPSIITTRDLLNIFFVIHDPTTLNRQGADTGTQYRSGIYYHTPEQKEIAGQTIRELEAHKIWGNPIVTEVEPIQDFYIAEDYHQEYFVNNPNQPYCMAVVAPKVSKFRKHFLDLWKKQTA